MERFTLEKSRVRLRLAANLSLAALALIVCAGILALAMVLLFLDRHPDALRAGFLLPGVAGVGGLGFLVRRKL
jgi:hypothetical protein